MAVAAGVLDPGPESARAGIACPAGTAVPVSFVSSILSALSPGPPEPHESRKAQGLGSKFEQREDWRRAIEVYLKAIQQIEPGGRAGPIRPSTTGSATSTQDQATPRAAVRSYERAADLYADQGFFNNAIALCGKILRVNPGPDRDLPQAWPSCTPARTSSSKPSRI